MAQILYDKIRGLSVKLPGIFGLVRAEVSMLAALERCSQRDIKIRTVIDVGASDGRWALMVRKFFPDAYYFLIEAQDGHEKVLEKIRSKYKNIDYIVSAAGDYNGTVYFDAGDPFGGLASHTPLEKNCIEVPMVMIDSLVKERSLTPPFLLKLDTHGFEVPIFEGAKETLKKTALIVVEAYNFKLTSKSLRFHEMCSYMESLGFRCIDLCDPIHRPNDRAFWQMDLLFIPSDRKEFLSNSYE